MNYHMQAALESMQNAHEAALPLTAPVIPAFRALSNYIKEFEDALDSEHEVAARLVSFGSEVKIRVLKVGYTAPALITFWGVNDVGDKVQLVQHVSQLSILLVAAKVEKREPYRVGFIHAESDHQQN